MPVKSINQGLTDHGQRGDARHVMQCHQNQGKMGSKCRGKRREERGDRREEIEGRSQKGGERREEKG
jgi:hypothetical protein